MYAGVFLLSLFGTLFLIPLNLPAVPREGCAGTAWPVEGMALAANTWTRVQEVGFLWLRAVPKGELPRARCKVQQWV